MWSAALLDLDGTLIDSASVWRDAECAIADLVVDSEMDAYLAGLQGETIEAIVSSLLEKTSRFQCETALEKYLLQTIETNVRFAPSFSDVSPFIAELRHKRIQIALVSNSTRGMIESSIQDKTWATQINHAFSAHELGCRPKPAPDVYLRACAKLSLARDSVFALEDSLPGATAALKAGVDTVLIDRSNAVPAYKIQAINDDQGALAQIKFVGRDLNEVWLWLRDHFPAYS